MSNRVSRKGLLLLPPMPATMLRSDRSDASVTRDHCIPVGWKPGTWPRKTALSTRAASKLWAEATAWASPVKWMFISSSGTTRAMPPPVPPPLMPNIGPKVGSRSVTTALCPSLPSPWVRPTDVVVLPSPAGVGVMPVTTTSLPCCPSRPFRASREILALW